MNDRYARVLVISMILFCPIALSAAPKLTEPTKEAWKRYIDLTEQRMNAELRSPSVALRFPISDLKSGRISTKQLNTEDPSGKEIEIPDGMVHHWAGAIFIPGMTLEKLIPWLQNYSHHQDYFKDVERSSLISPSAGDNYSIFLRLTRSKLGVTVHFNTKHDVVYSRWNPTFASSASRSTQILQVKDAGATSEKEYPEGDDSGYLWRLNSYWRYFERDGGVVVECESVALSKSLGLINVVRFMTFGLINPKKIAAEIAREALDQTLTDLRNGARGGPKKQGRK